MGTTKDIGGQWALAIGTGLAVIVVAAASNESVRDNVKEYTIGKATEILAPLKGVGEYKHDRP
jgi:hypothetical protein